LLDDDHALTCELPGDAAALAEAPAVAGERVAHLLRGAVAVVGEGLDQQRDPPRRVALVDDLLVLLTVAELTGPPLDRAFDVLVGDAEALRLLDRARERHVSLDAAAALSRRNLDRAQKLRVHVRPLGVGRFLLALDRRPLGVAGH